MKGVASNTLLVLGHGTLVLTCGYVLTLLHHNNLLHTSCGAVVTYCGFLLLGLCGLTRYLYPVTFVQRCYRELSSVTHAIGLLCLALVSLQVHNMVDIPDTTPSPYVLLLVSFLLSRLLFGAWFDDVMTKFLWASSAIVMFYTAIKARHWTEMVGPTFLASSFFTFYFNRMFTDNRVIFGISDLVWYLLLLNISLLVIGHSLFAVH
ncbi:hypothetical protein ACHWQZ_G006559 [Mnemiopsis leidyi]